jgi:hypothetical protein
MHNPTTTCESEGLNNIRFGAANKAEVPNMKVLCTDNIFGKLQGLLSDTTYRIGKSHMLILSAEC